jgi:uncharacterized membrane protein YhhN
MVASWVLSTAAVLSGVIYIWTTYAGAQTQRFLFKPLTTALILGVALALPDAVSPLYRNLITVGILFSLAGDIFLMLPNNWFVWGLVSFLIAHLFFIAGYVERASVHMHWYLLTPFALYGVALLYLLWSHVGDLRLPVLIYALVLLAMGWQATELWWEMRDLAALLAMLGAILFVASDSILALDKFRAPIPHRDVLIMSTYYGALLLITWSMHQFARS